MESTFDSFFAITFADIEKLLVDASMFKDFVFVDDKMVQINLICR